MKKKEELLKINNRYFSSKILAVLLSNIIIFTVFGYCYMLNQNDINLYLSIAQEDDFIEWTTVWSFLIASFGGVFGVILGRNQFKKFEWFYAGLALFCFLVAMEEISWGQRFFGYLPPDYFLENNFQQELTVHNMMGTSLRKFILKAILLGYGVILPLLMLIPAIHRLSNKLRIIVPPIELIPSFFLTFYLYEIYPWRLTGEVVELMMGFSILFTILFRLWDFSFLRGKSRGTWQFATTLGVASITIGLGFGTANWTSYRVEKNPILQNICYKELEAIKSDFIWKTNQQGYSPFKKYFHRRLYSAVKVYDFDWMYEGKFAALTEQGLSQDRAKFFLDPWNMPYWAMFKLNRVNGRKRLIIYSFGPNRKRDSEDWEIKGDDIGLVLFDTDLK